MDELSDIENDKNVLGYELYDILDGEHDNEDNEVIDSELNYDMLALCYKRFFFLKLDNTFTASHKRHWAQDRDSTSSSKPNTEVSKSNETSRLESIFYVLL